MKFIADLFCKVWRDTDGNVDLFFSGVGTGGTISGVAQYIKGSEKYNMPSLKAEMKAIAVEPMEQMLVTDAMGGEKIGPQGPHKIEVVWSHRLVTISQVYTMYIIHWVSHRFFVMV